MTAIFQIAIFIEFLYNRKKLNLNPITSSRKELKFFLSHLQQYRITSKSILEVFLRCGCTMWVRGGGSKIRTPRWDDCSGVFNRRYTYEKENKEQV